MQGGRASSVKVRVKPDVGMKGEAIDMSKNVEKPLARFAVAKTRELKDSDVAWKWCWFC